MSGSQRPVSQAEYLARRLLANGATGTLSGLRALASSYPYHRSDLRPLALVLSLLRDPPLSYPSLRSGTPEGLDTEPILRALVCFDVAHHVGQSMSSDTASCAAFSAMLKEDWPSLLPWLTYTLEYSASVMPGEHVGVLISAAANFLVNYGTRPPFAFNTIVDWTSTVRLAARIWTGDFNQGLTFRKVTLATVEFFSSCLEMDGPAKTAVVDLFQEPNKARPFFKSFATQISALERDPTEAGALRVVLMHDFYVLLVENLSRSTDWRNIWRWIITRSPLKACIKTTLSLLSRPVPIDRWRLAQLGGLLVAMEEDPESIISKVVRLAQAGLAPLLYECIQNAGDISGASEMVIFGYLRHLASYLPYQRVSRAVAKSLHRHQANSPHASVLPGWSFFYSTLGLSALSAAKRRAYYAFACDNLNHLRLRDQDASPSEGEHRKVCGGCKTVFYCSEECQREDWESLHRYECSEAANMLRARCRDGQWFPWGSKGSHGALLVHVFNLLRLRGADVGPVDGVSTLDWTMGAPGDAYARDRLDAMLSLPDQTGTRLVEGTYRHGKELIHVLATLREGHWPSGYTFLNGVGMISERLEGNL